MWHLHAHFLKVEGMFPTFSYWPTIAPPAGCLLQNTFLEQNAQVMDALPWKVNEDMPPFSHYPTIAPPGGHNNLPDLAKTCARRSTASSSAMFCTQHARNNHNFLLDARHLCALLSFSSNAPSLPFIGIYLNATLVVFTLPLPPLSPSLSLPLPLMLNW